VTHKPWGTPNDQDFFCYKGSDYYERIRDLDITVRPFDVHNEFCPSHRSNFLKWNKLSTIGGIYADMDILWIKPINEFYNEIKDFDVGICQTEYLSIGLLASSGNEFFKDIYINGLNNFHENNYQTAGVENIYNLYKKSSSEILNSAKKKYPELKFYNILMDIIYPYDSTQVEQSFSGKFDSLPKNTIGYHWYAGHPVAQVFNNRLNENTYKGDNSLFSQLVKKYLK
jgi:hypothetical protein